jgi:hypothetical protein
MGGNFDKRVLQASLGDRLIENLLSIIYLSDELFLTFPTSLFKIACYNEENCEKIISALLFLVMCKDLDTVKLG